MMAKGSGGGDDGGSGKAHNTMDFWINEISSALFSTICCEI